MEQRDFFVSYTKTNQAWALWIANLLKRNGYSVYVQALDIHPGHDFLKRMEQFIENSQNFIAVWSKDYSESNYCMLEFHAAVDALQNGRINALLPVRVDDFPMKALYAALVHVDLPDMSGASEAILADAVRRAVPLPNAAADTPELKAEAEKLFQLGNNRYWEEDYATARAYWERAAAKGNAAAINALGKLYEKGYGVPQNDAKALEYYQKAAKSSFTAFQNMAKLRNKMNR